MATTKSAPTAEKLTGVKVIPPTEKPAPSTIAGSIRDAVRSSLGKPKK